MISLLLLLLLLCVVLGVTLKPRHAFLVFLVSWVVLPNGAANYVNMFGLPMHAFLEVGLLLMGVLALVRTKGILPPRNKAHLRVVGITLLLALAIQYTVLAVAYLADLPTWVPLSRSVASTDRLSTTAGVLMVIRAAQSAALVVFFLGLARTVQTRRQLDVFFQIFLLLGLELVAEVVLLIFIGWPSGLAQYAVHPTLGNFTSITLNGVLGVSMVAGSAMAASLYFWRSRGQVLYLFLTIPLLIPTLLTVKRGALVGTVVLLYLGITTLSSSTRVTRAVITAVAGLLLLVGGTVMRVDPASAIERVYAGTALVGRASDLSSVLLRLGLQARVVDIAISKFPFGVGAGMTPLYVDSPDVPTRLTQPITGSYFALFEYDRAVSGEKRTSSHNLFIESLSEFGVMALAVMLALLALVRAHRRWARRWRHSVIPWRTLDPHSRMTFSSRLTSWAAIVFFGITYLFYTTPFVYVTFFVFVVGLTQMDDDPV